MTLQSLQPPSGERLHLKKSRHRCICASLKGMFICVHVLGYIVSNYVGAAHNPLAPKNAHSMRNLTKGCSSSTLFTTPAPQITRTTVMLVGKALPIKKAFTIFSPAMVTLSVFGIKGVCQCMVTAIPTKKVESRSRKQQLAISRA